MNFLRLLLFKLIPMMQQKVLSIWLDLFKTKADADEGNFDVFEQAYLKDNTIE